MTSLKNARIDAFGKVSPKVFIGEFQENSNPTQSQHDKHEKIA
jgi:hypothetical protein